MTKKNMDELLGISTAELDAMAADFENGSWNRSEYGKPGVGRPAAFGEVMRPVTFKETPTVIAAMDERAAALGSTRSDYIRGLVAKDLAIA